MKVKNLTSEVQSLKVVDLIGGREFTIYIEGHSCSDITGMYIADMSQIDHKFEIISTDNIFSKEIESTDPSSEVVTSEEYEESVDIEDEIPEEVNEIPEEIKDEDTEEVETEEAPTAESLSSTFVCDICGAEFASDRGLSSHKTRSHK